MPKYTKISLAAALSLILFAGVGSALRGQLAGSGVQGYVCNIGDFQDMGSCKQSNLDAFRAKESAADVFFDPDADHCDDICGKLAGDGVHYCVTMDEDETLAVNEVSECEGLFFTDNNQFGIPDLLRAATPTDEQGANESTPSGNQDPEEEEEDFDYEIVDETEWEENEIDDDVLGEFLEDIAANVTDDAYATLPDGTGVEFDEIYDDLFVEPEAFPEMTGNPQDDADIAELTDRFNSDIQSGVSMGFGGAFPGWDGSAMGGTQDGVDDEEASKTFVEQFTADDVLPLQTETLKKNQDSYPVDFTPNHVSIRGSSYTFTVEQGGERSAHTISTVERQGDLMRIVIEHADEDGESIQWRMVLDANAFERLVTNPASFTLRLPDDRGGPDGVVRLTSGTQPASAPRVRPQTEPRSRS